MWRRRVGVSQESIAALGEILLLAFLLNSLLIGPWMAGQVWLRGAHLTPEQGAAHRQLGVRGVADHHRHLHGEHHDQHPAPTLSLPPRPDRAQMGATSSINLLSVIAATTLAEVSDLGVWQVCSDGLDHSPSDAPAAGNSAGSSDTARRPGQPSCPPIPPPRLAS